MVEMMLSQGFSTVFPYGCLDLVQEHAWHVDRTTTEGLFYAISSTAGRLHCFLYPQYIINGCEIDHGDRNGLNNRPSNIGPGGNGWNAMNRRARSKTGILGVTFRVHSKCFRTYITVMDLDRKKGYEERFYYWRDYPSVRHAFLDAINWVRERRAEQKIIRTFLEHQRSSEYEGVGVEATGCRGTFRFRGQKKIGYFPFAMFGDRAELCAVEWVQRWTLSIEPRRERALRWWFYQSV